MAGKRPVGVAAHVSSVGSSAFFFLQWFSQENVGTSVSQTSCWQMPVQMRRKDRSKTGAPSKISLLRLILNGGWESTIYSSQCWTPLSNATLCSFELAIQAFARHCFQIHPQQPKHYLINLDHTSQLGCK